MIRRPWFLSILLLIGTSVSAVAASSAYLSREWVSVRMDGVDNRSTLPLDPSRQYRVVLTSRYNLRPLLDRQVACEEHATREFLFFTKTTRTCRLPLKFNDQLLPSIGFHSSTEGSFFYDRTPADYFVSRLDFFVWGTGKPLLFQTVSDFSDAIAEAELEIADFTIEQEAAALQARLEEVRQQAEEERSHEAAKRIRLEWEARSREEAAKQRLAEEQARAERLRTAEAEERAAASVAKRTTTLIIGGLAACFLVCLPLTVKSHRRFQYEQLRIKWEDTKRVNLDLSLHVDDLSRQIAELTNPNWEEEARRILTEREQEVQRILDEEARRQDHIANRLHELFLQHSHPELVVREDETYITRYAARHHDDLLKARKQITDEYERFLKDQAVEHFRIQAATLWLRTYPVFRWRCLAAADRLDGAESLSPPKEEPRRRETPDEWRARYIQRQRVKAKDYAEQIRTRIADEQAFIAMLQQEFPTLDDDALQAELQRYRQEISMMEEDTHGKTPTGQPYKRA